MFMASPGFNLSGDRSLLQVRESKPASAFYDFAAPANLRPASGREVPALFHCVEFPAYAD
jgi:hypothetical protein